VDEEEATKWGLILPQFPPGDLRAMCAHLLADRAARVALLKKLEFVSPPSDSKWAIPKHCPACGVIEHNVAFEGKHKPDCELAEALK
jgi:hypothetical protein